MSMDGTGGGNDAEIKQLMNFYGVNDLWNLVIAQARHIERLQAKLPPLRDEFPRTPREG